MEEIIFPNQIRMIRRTRGKTMKDIASILDVSLSAISKIEKGYRRIDEDQLSKISAFLQCPKESIFVQKSTSQPEVFQAWNKEQERRKKINENSGLKTLGAGLRYLRGNKMLTLQDVANKSGLTLSVYHRIEMGQREVNETQFQKIAFALGYDPETLQIKIYELNMAGKLQELKKTTRPGIFHPKGGYNDLPLKDPTELLHNIPFLAETKAEEKLCTLPSLENTFALQSEIYLMNSLIRTILIVSRTEKITENSWAVLKTNDSYQFGFFDKKQNIFKTQKETYSVDLQSPIMKVVAILPNI